MNMTFEQARALFGSDEQMARALFEQLAIVRIDLELQQALRRRAENRLAVCLTQMTMKNDGGITE